jgi:beta-lactam-binding protein with PASTA domain
MRSFFRFVLLGLVLLAVALVSAVVTMSLAIHGQEVAVPNLVGSTPTEARALASKSGLEVNVEQRYFSNAVPEGKILSQVPDAGAKVRRGWEIRVAQSLGPQRVEIPNVLGQSERAAQMNIQHRGLDLGVIAQTKMKDTQPGQVISQSPPPNASDVSAPKINLLVAQSADPQAFVMPNFIGMPVGTATQTVQDAGLRIGTVTVAGQPIETTPSGAPLPNAVRPSAGSIIVAQTPAAGEKVLAGSVVSFQTK